MSCDPPPRRLVFVARVTIYAETFNEARSAVREMNNFGYTVDELRRVGYDGDPENDER